MQHFVETLQSRGGASAGLPCRRKSHAMTSQPEPFSTLAAKTHELCRPASPSNTGSSAWAGMASTPPPPHPSSLSGCRWPTGRSARRDQHSRSQGRWVQASSRPPIGQLSQARWAVAIRSKEGGNLDQALYRAVSSKAHLLGRAITTEDPGQELGERLIQAARQIHLCPRVDQSQQRSRQGS